MLQLRHCKQLVISVFEDNWSVSTKFSRTRGRYPRPIFTWIDRQMNAWQFSHKETLWQTFFDRSAILEGKRPFCVFEPPWGGLGATDAVHLRLIGKCVLDILDISVNWTFFTRCYGWGTMSKKWLKIGIFKERGQLVWPKILRHNGSPPTDGFSCQKTRWMDLLYGIRILQ